MLIVNAPKKLDKTVLIVTDVPRRQLGLQACRHPSDAITPDNDDDNVLCLQVRVTFVGAERLVKEMLHWFTKVLHKQSVPTPCLPQILCNYYFCNIFGSRCPILTFHHA